MTEKVCNMHYHLDLGEYLDRLTILQLKEVNRAGELKEQITKEIQDIVHDINVLLNTQGRMKQITGEFLRDLIILAQFNTHVWNNENTAREAGKEDDATTARVLRLTHSLNGIRVEARNRLQRLLNGRIEKKVDCLANTMAEEYKDQYTPSSY